MADEATPVDPIAPSEGDTATAVAEPEVDVREEAAPRQREPRHLPPYKVLLHNDDVNEVAEVVYAIRKVTPLTIMEATQRMLEAHHSGVALLLVTHRERAELYIEQFQTFKLTVTIEPAEE